MGVRASKWSVQDSARNRLSVERSDAPVVDECVLLASLLHEGRLTRPKLWKLLLGRARDEMRLLCEARGIDWRGELSRWSERSGTSDLTRRYQKAKPKVD